MTYLSLLEWVLCSPWIWQGYEVRGCGSSSPTDDGGVKKNVGVGPEGFKEAANIGQAIVSKF